MGGGPFVGRASAALLLVSHAWLLVSLDALLESSGVSAPARAAGAASLSLAALAAPLLGGGLVEATGGTLRDALTRALLLCHPIHAAVGTALGVDWLRAERVYAVSILARFHPYRYPSVTAAFLAQALPALALTWGAVLLSRRGGREAIHASPRGAES